MSSIHKLVKETTNVSDKKWSRADATAWIGFKHSVQHSAQSAHDNHGVNGHKIYNKLPVGHVLWINCTKQ